MRSIDAHLDRFCYKHPKLSIPNLMLIISIGNVIVLLLDTFSRGAFSMWISFIPALIFQGQIWRLVTFIFVPLNENLLWFFFSVLLYYSIGRSLEQSWGSTKFTVYYCLGVIIAVVYGLIMGLLGYGLSQTANMYYLNMSLFIAYATLYPDATFMIYFIIPVKAKWLAWLDLGFLGLAAIGNLIGHRVPMALLPVMALGNYLLFFWSDIVGMLTRTKRRHSRQTVNFKQATRQAQQHKGYLHKCAVCGKTDTDYPNEEFRYCSKCNGYYCYCSEHIASHVHIE